MRDARRLMLGFQLTTALISMCIVNTAAVAMMLPILSAVTCQLSPSGGVSGTEESVEKKGEELESVEDVGKMKTFDIENNEGDVKRKRYSR